MAHTRHLDEFVGGWLTGNFSPALVRQESVELAVKRYAAGDLEPRHHHRIATEYTVIASGKVRMETTTYEAGAVIEVAPGESTDFEALEDTVTVVLKFPSVTDDKYLD